ncbi:hypothetical protein [Dyadobacter luticola]|uniref:Uncharacterized protein n=1 Tax=Dyadobacter luticola TaxID=1979387 RepID=A0A5R9KP11_9BACT|nr:hypothetical protein [Dyadobacter luticola]TLU98022.1 hypothetical protein FEN17_24860 [Dyadobacter luticola]
MKTFATIQEAFEFWVKNIYPSLAPDMKKGRAVQAMQDYLYERGISEKRMRRILLEFGHFEIETIVRLKP